MPIYDYSCTACGRAFDELVRGDTRVACPGCGSRRVTRRLSLPARPATGARPAEACEAGPMPGGGCCGGACHGQPH